MLCVFVVSGLMHSPPNPPPPTFPKKKKKRKKKKETSTKQKTKQNKHTIHEKARLFSAVRCLHIHLALVVNYRIQFEMTHSYS